MRRFAFLAGVVAAHTMAVASYAARDGKDLYDPTRPVMQLGRTHAVFQWYTTVPTPTRLQLRTSTAPCNTPVRAAHPADVWAARGVRAIAGPPGDRTYHRLDVRGLSPAMRYAYRIYDPAAEPTDIEKRWGAAKPWRREFSFSTLAPSGRMTIVRIPIKVLLMPNVLNVASAYAIPGAPAPLPQKLSMADLALIRREYADSARFLFVNSGMRVWYDYRFFVDDRLQRWGPEPANTAPEYRDLPVCRSYAGQDFAAPGGGDFTIVDTNNLPGAGKAPVFEKQLYVGQIEQAFPRRWNPTAHKWEFYNSGGGTFGIDDWSQGVPGRSQFLGGGDTAWLATHEFHHQIESLGSFSLANREDDRVIFDHFAPRKRVKRADGSWDEWVWSTSWKHGEHWDGIAYFDRMLTPIQWLRLHFGQTISVVDSDGDGVPDDDPRLPFDERRFGSDPTRKATDGVMPDLAKAQLSTWAPYGPLTTSWDKAPQPRIRPNPRVTDSDGDGIPDSVDPYPLYPWQPLIWPLTAVVDGDPAEWRSVPLSGRVSAHGVTVTFQQGHDDNFYFACFRLSGPWQHAAVGLDGEGQGYYTTDSTYAFDIGAGPPGTVPTVRITSGNRCPGMMWKAALATDGTATVEVGIPNRGEGLWFWQGGGREVGAAVSISTRDNKLLSIYEPYNLFYCRMLERYGKAQLPAGAPPPLSDGPGVSVFDFTGAAIGAEWQMAAGSWELKDGALRFAKGDDGTNYVVLPGFAATDFDVWADFEAASDLHIGAWTDSAARIDNMTDYVAFLGGFGNARSAIRAFGIDVAAEDVGIPPGRHTMQLSRCAGRLWLLLDGKAVVTGVDPRPDARVTRIGFLGGWDGRQAIYRARIRATGR